MSSNSTLESTPTLLGMSKVEETPLPPPLEDLRRDGEFWIEDGNLILVAKDVAFRVYRGLLAEQSTVLAEMAAAASLEDFFKLFDGCPVVHLSDSPQDLTHLLRILLPKTRRRLHPKDEQDHSPDELSSLERYTDDFDEWCSDYQTFIARLISRPYTHCISGVGVVNIARLTNTPSLLPAALYTCSLLGDAVMDGWEREDGCVEHLSADDLKRCFRAQERLCQEGIKIMCQIFGAPGSAGCLCPAECCSRLTSAALNLAPQLTARWALSSWAEVIRLKTLKVCSKCKEELELRDEKARREVWDKLPEIFGIEVPGWGNTANSGVSD